MSANNTSTPKQLPSEEWDFRRVSEKELPTVLEYEYARSSKHFSTLISEWLDSAFLGFSPDALRKLKACDAALSRDSSGPTTIRKALEVAGRLESNISHDVFAEIKATQSADLLRYNNAAEFAMRYDLFPKAWFKLPTDFRRSRIRLGVRYRFLGLLDHEWCAIRFPKELYESGSVKAVLFSVCWSWSNKELLQEFKRWLEVMRPKAYSGKGRVGRGAETPFHLLKQLSAWRLSQAGYSCAKAATLIAARKKKIQKRLSLTFYPSTLVAALGPPRSKKPQNFSQARTCLSASLTRRSQRSH